MHLAGILQGMRGATFPAGRPEAGCLLASKEGEGHAEKKGAIHVFQGRHFILPSGARRGRSGGCELDLGVAVVNNRKC